MNIRIFAFFMIAFSSMPTPAIAQEGGVDAFFKCEDSTSHPSLEGTRCATIEAPLDHARPGSGTVQLFARKFPAQSEVKGQLWLVAGGPGESGASFYPLIQTVRETAAGFDIIVPDHRGTGFSSRLCPEEENPSSAGGSALVGEEWSTCFGTLNAKAERTKAFSISNAAHDLNQLITRFDTGVPTYLYSVSYGTQLALRMLTLEMQADLDGLILDSLVPLESNTTLDLSHRSKVTDSVGRKVLRDCDERPDCRRYFDAGSEHALRQLLEREDIEELAGPNLKYRLSALLDFSETRSLIPNVIAGLQSGDPAWLDHAMDRLANMAPSLDPYPQSGSSIPLVSLISRSENNARPALTAEIIKSEAEEQLFTSPLPSLLLSGGFPTYETDQSFGVSAKNIPPTMVLQGTLDPKTPYHGAQEHVAALATAGDIELVSVEGAAHFVMLTAPEEFKRVVRAFIDENAEN